jgi:hypothetical protein
MVRLENLDERDAKSDARFTPSPSEDLFDRLAWWYTVCRERLLQDDTESIVQILASFGLKLKKPATLFQPHPWERVVTWRTDHYQYAVCAKSAGDNHDNSEKRVPSWPVEDFSI